MTCPPKLLPTRLPTLITVHPSTDGTISLCIAIDGVRPFVTKGWRTYGSALDHAARLCGDRSGTYSASTDIQGDSP